MGIILGGNTLSGTNFSSLGDTPSTPNVVTDGLVLHLDAGNSSSYNSSGYYYDCGYGYQYYVSNPGCTAANTKWFDISGREIANEKVFENNTIIPSKLSQGLYFIQGRNKDQAFKATIQIL